jgi:hypothetical protein
MADPAKSFRRYYVVSRGDGWEVVADCRYLAKFPSQADATRQAIEWAQLDGESGEPAQVLVEARDDELRVAWTHDPVSEPTSG